MLSTTQVVELHFSEMEKRMVALEEEKLHLNHCLLVFDQLQEEYWVNQVAIEERANKVHAQSTFKEGVTADLQSLNKKVMWSNNMIHEDCRKLHLQMKRIDSLVAFEERVSAKFKEMPTHA